MVLDDGPSPGGNLSVTTRSRREESSQDRSTRKWVCGRVKGPFRAPIAKQSCGLRTLSYAWDQISLEVLNVLLCKALSLPSVDPG